MPKSFSTAWEPHFGLSDLRFIRDHLHDMKNPYPYTGKDKDIETLLDIASTALSALGEVARASEDEAVEAIKYAKEFMDQWNNA
ncbi:hypothetical protein ES703_55763 [subsurface metagenome]